MTDERICSECDCGGYANGTELQYPDRAQRRRQRRTDTIIALACGFGVGIIAAMLGAWLN